jgi:hypothetical protein
MYLISQAEVFPVDIKPGTLTRDDTLNIRPYQDVINKKRLTQEEGIDSLPQLLSGLGKKLKETSFFHVIELTPADIEELKTEIEKTKPPQMKEVVKRAIRYWTLDIPRTGSLQPIINEAMRSEFLLDGEDNQFPLMQQNDNYPDISHLMTSQAKINRVL